MYAFKCLQLNTKAWIPNPGNLSDVEMLQMAGLLAQHPHDFSKIITNCLKKVTVADMGTNSFVFVGAVVR